MTLTLDKTWRKDTWETPWGGPSATKDTNGWLVWAIKEMFLLGNNGVKAGPNAWTVVGSCDSTQYAMDGTDYLIDYTNMVSGTGNHSWFVLRNAALGAGSGLEICIAHENQTSYDNELTIAYSWSAGFTGGATDARPTATDEFQTHDAVVFLPTGATRFVINRLFSTDGEATRFFVTNGLSVSSMGLFVEKLKNPTPMVTENVVVMARSGALTRSKFLATMGTLLSTGSFYMRADGENVAARPSYLCLDGLSAPDQSLATMLGADGKELVSRVRLWSNTVARKGILGEPFDMYNISPTGYFTLVAGAGGTKDFFSYGDYIFGNDGAVSYG